MTYVPFVDRITTSALLVFSLDGPTQYIGRVCREYGPDEAHLSRQILRECDYHTHDTAEAAIEHIGKKQ